MKTLQHLNGDIFVAVDVETTGDTPGFHEVVQIALVPLDSNLNEIEVMPFYINLKPERPETAQKAAMKVNKLDIEDLQLKGMDRWVACDMLRKWIDTTLGLGYNKYGTKKARLRPVGHNFVGFDQVMLKAWLEDCGEEYTEFFYPIGADTMLEGASINTKFGMRGVDPKLPKLVIKEMCREMGIPYEAYKHHDALYDARLAGRLFKKLMETDIVGLI